MPGLDESAQFEPHPNDSRYRTLFERSPAGMIRATEEGQILECNPAMAQMFGYESVEELAQHRTWELYHSREDRTQLLEKLHREGIITNVEVRGRRKDGKPVWVLANYMLHLGTENAPPVIEGALLDVTEQRRLREELSQSQKMEALGQLAGGITHDFNNLLMVIGSYSEMLLEQFGELDPVRQHAAAIQNAGRRAADLTRKLLVFSRKQIPTLRLVDLKCVIADLMRILGRVLREDIELCVQQPEQLWMIQADPTQLEQVLMNLVVNARDAMPRGGKLLMETSNLVLADSRGLMPSGEYVLLSVSDTGHGIPKEVLPRIFEPFFTTKGDDKGTGLGLATVYAIVKQMGGHIFAYSEPGYGTTFKVYFPRSWNVASESTARETAAERRKGSETILLVEDDLAVREAACYFLRSLGYQVLAAESGHEAAEMVQENTVPVDLLITDVVMPGISGCDLARALLSRHPEIKVLFMSGHAEGTVREHGDIDLRRSFLQKPFTLQLLAERIRETLDTGPRSASAKAGASNS